MKKNGFTVVELITSFALTVVIVYFLFQLIIGLKNMYVNNGVKANLMNTQILMSQGIYEDLREKTILDIKNCGTYCIQFEFNDGKSKKLTVDTSSKLYSYGDYAIHLASGSSFGDLKSTNTTVSESTYGDYDTILNIKIPVEHPLVEGDYGINIIYQYSSLTHVYTDPSFIGDTVFSKAIQNYGVGVSKTTENGANVYYYRGNLGNNNLIFANFCWKMVRTTSTNGVKLIYNGLPSGAGNSRTCPGTKPYLLNSNGSDLTTVFNSDASSAKYLGYMYDDNTVDSVVKGVVDSWYEANIKNTTYDSVVEPHNWCMDRSGETNGGDLAPATRNSAGKPTLDCPRNQDVVSLKVGLLTMDEVYFASGTGYLNSGYTYWLLSPKGYISSDGRKWVFCVISDGRLIGQLITAKYYVRPSLVIDGSLGILKGDGSSTNPFVVNI